VIVAPAPAAQPVDVPQKTVKKPRKKSAATQPSASKPPEEDLGASRK